VLRLALGVYCKRSAVNTNVEMTAVWREVIHRFAEGWCQLSQGRAMLERAPDQEPEESLPQTCHKPMGAAYCAESGRSVHQSASV
jgi:hypothetical protein